MKFPISIKRFLLQTTEPFRSSPADGDTSEGDSRLQAVVLLPCSGHREEKDADADRGKKNHEEQQRVLQSIQQKKTEDSSRKDQITYRDLIKRGCDARTYENGVWWRNHKGKTSLLSTELAESNRHTFVRKCGSAIIANKVVARRQENGLGRVS